MMTDYQKDMLDDDQYKTRESVNIIEITVDQLPDDDDDTCWLHPEDCEEEEGNDHAVLKAATVAAIVTGD